ncbi:RNA-guided endonuclease TnpB family protein [Silvanigrella sp.]|uniref:RNA-guided endonuclease TnpB family protein n=1 Tax=Silvanigrella sp. TaxID=2024976 RepID=UPI0037C8F959
MITTYHYRIKDSGKSGRTLKKMSSSVNFVWNYCKNTQREALKNRSVKRIIDPLTGKTIFVPYFFTKFEMNSLVSGSSKELGIHSQTIQAISEEYTTRRKQFKNILRWRGKNSLGWIPFKATAIKIYNNKVSYNKNTFQFWNSREIPDDAIIKSGSFAQDSRGRWYLNITFETRMNPYSNDNLIENGVFIDSNYLAKCSNGIKIDIPKISIKYIRKIKILNKLKKKFLKKKPILKILKRKAPKTKQEKNLRAKIENIKLDHFHKESSKIINFSSSIITNQISVKRKKSDKNNHFISFGPISKPFQNMLCYKAIRAGRTFKVIPEKDLIWAFSKCCSLQPRTILRIRVWKCRKCGKINHFSTNADKNLLSVYKNPLRIGHDTPRSI